MHPFKLISARKPLMHPCWIRLCPASSARRAAAGRDGDHFLHPYASGQHVMCGKIHGDGVVAQGMGFLPAFDASGNDAAAEEIVTTGR